jgi:hypothetical protein
MGHLMPRESDLQCPDCAHQILDFADDRASAQTQVMFDTEPGKESQDQFCRQRIRIHVWVLGLNFLSDE